METPPDREGAASGVANLETARSSSAPGLTPSETNSRVLESNVLAPVVALARNPSALPLQLEIWNGASNGTSAFPSVDAAAAPAKNTSMALNPYVSGWLLDGLYFLIMFSSRGGPRN
jgi:hypothetical protein